MLHLLFRVHRVDDFAPACIRCTISVIRQTLSLGSGRLLLRLTEEFAAQALILIITHHEHLLYPLDRIPVQLLVLLLAISACSTRACSLISQVVSNFSIVTVSAFVRYIIGFAGSIDNFLD